MVNINRSQVILACFIITLGRGVILGFNFPLTACLLGFLGLEAFHTYIFSKKKSKIEDSVELFTSKFLAQEQEVAGKIKEVTDLNTRVGSLESKLSLISSTRR